MNATAVRAARFTYELPPELEAAEPPEVRGLTRDAVRMLVAHKHDHVLQHSTFVLLPSLLDPGDIVVLNTSGTIPAAINATTNDGQHLVVHLSTQIDDEHWIVEPRRVVGTGTERWQGAPVPRQLHLAGDATLKLKQPYAESNGRLWIATLLAGRRALSWLAVYGKPIRYGYVKRPWPLEMYQNVYATEPGSAEMPSAGRPFTPEIITRLVAKGVGVTPIVLHTGVASLEADELPYPERVRVPAETADRVNAARAAEHRVVAVGTTVVRALETCADSTGMARPYDGWTDLVISPTRKPRLVDGLLTGWHEPASSHLMMLESILGDELLQAEYQSALEEQYRWHEFGDMNLILP